MQFVFFTVFRKCIETNFGCEHMLTIFCLTCFYLRWIINDFFFHQPIPLNIFEKPMKNWHILLTVFISHMETKLFRIGRISKLVLLLFDKINNLICEQHLTTQSTSVYHTYWEEAIVRSRRFPDRPRKVLQSIKVSEY